MSPEWPLAVAMTESSLGLNQLSPTGCRGTFQMSTIAMKDLLAEMGKSDLGNIIGITCGVLFLRLLKQRWGSEQSATSHFCDPKDRDFYIKRVEEYLTSFGGKSWDSV